ncbi:MAG: head GIN domain-containing protein [Chitinophagales bacterium]
MKKIPVFLLGLLICGCLYAQQINDPNAVKVDVKNFHGIDVSSAFDVYLTQSKDEAVAVSASDEKFRERIKVEVKDGILRIRYDNGLRWNNGKMKLKAYISFINLDQLSASGACDVFVIGDLKADELKIELSGASDLKMTKAGDMKAEGKIDVKKLAVDLSGASDMKINGNASQLKVEASGASDFKGFDLTTDICDATASGASNVQVTVNKELSAHATGASDVHYKGEGMIRDIKTSGASSVSKSRS